LNIAFFTTTFFASLSSALIKTVTSLTLSLSSLVQTRYINLNENKELVFLHRFEFNKRIFYIENSALILEKQLYTSEKNLE